MQRPISTPGPQRPACRQQHGMMFALPALRCACDVSQLRMTRQLMAETPQEQPELAWSDVLSLISLARISAVVWLFFALVLSFSFSLSFFLSCTDLHRCWSIGNPWKRTQIPEHSQKRFHTHHIGAEATLQSWSQRWAVTSESHHHRNRHLSTTGRNSCQASPVMSPEKGGFKILLNMQSLISMTRPDSLNNARRTSRSERSEHAGRRCSWSHSPVPLLERSAPLRLSKTPSRKVDGSLSRCECEDGISKNSTVKELFWGIVFVLIVELT